jgi:hypothetical protein
MADFKLEKTQTGIASEFYAAGELGRLGYNVTLTFGNTKAIDLLVEKDNKVYKIQVKGIQTSKSLCWNLNKTKVSEDTYFVLINLHVDQPKVKPEFFILTGKEALSLFKDTKKEGEKRAYLDYNKVKGLGDKYKDRWEIFGKPEKVEDDLIVMKGTIRGISKYADGTERFEIYLKDSGTFPIIYNEKLNYTWVIAGKSYIISFRFTKQIPGWVCPDVYDWSDPGKKYSLSSILLENGFKKNEVVNIFLDSSNKELEIVKSGK